MAKSRLPSEVRRRSVRAALALVLLAGSSAAGGAPRADVEVRVASTDHSTELIKTVPIGKRAGAKPRVLLSLDADRLGDLRAGDLARGLRRCAVFRPA